MANENIIVPPLKWAGGKRWLVSRYPKVFPTDYKTYVEPFLGGGAVFLHLNPVSAILGDLNAELINLYAAIRDNHKLVLQHLRRHARNHSKDYYYRVRRQKCRSAYSAAARILYLNRTCWNGLYRVNRLGEFNVPIGTKSAVILPTDDFSSLATRLKRARILESDFRETITKAQKRDFLFVDPPYTVSHNHNGFIKYNENIFSWDDQVSLSEQLYAASQRGVQVLSTNADHQSLVDLYIKGFNIYSIDRASILAGSSASRRMTSELLISNYLLPVEPGMRVVSLNATNRSSFGAIEKHASH